jgi:hypothetical protein
MQQSHLELDYDNNATGWREIGMFFSCVPSELYPWDPDVLKAIWEFDPGVIPIWVRWVFQAPAEDSNHFETVVFGRHALGRYVDNPSEGTVTFKPGQVTMPDMPCQGVKFKTPNILIRILEGFPIPGAPSDLPHEYVPFDWRVYYKLRRDYLENITAKEYARKEMERIETQRAKRKADLEAEHAYRMKDFGKYVEKKIEQISDVEHKEILREQAAQRMGYRTRESKPLIDLGS